MNGSEVGQVSDVVGGGWGIEGWVGFFRVQGCGVVFNVVTIDSDLPHTLAQ